MTSPTASVVVATFNRPEHVRICLAHLMQQTVVPDRIIVVDASPGAATQEVADEFPDVIYLRNDKGPGSTATSRAIGMSRVDSKVVAFIDDDAYAEPDWLAQLLRRYEDPDVAAVGGRARNGQPHEESEGLSEVGLLLPDGSLTGYFAADPGRDLDVDHLLGANMSVRRDVVERLGGIHDYYPGTCLREETDILLRMRAAGFRIVFTPTAIVEHVAGPYAKGRRFDLRYHYYGARNHVVLLATTLGFDDPRTVSHYRTTARRVGYAVVDSLRTLRDPARPMPRDRVRGAAGVTLRAITLVAGTLTGTAAAVRVGIRQDRTQAALT